MAYQQVTYAPPMAYQPIRQPVVVAIPQAQLQSQMTTAVHLDASVTVSGGGSSGMYASWRRLFHTHVVPLFREGFAAWVWATFIGVIYMFTTHALIRALAYGFLFAVLVVGLHSTTGNFIFLLCDAFAGRVGAVRCIFALLFEIAGSLVGAVTAIYGFAATAPFTTWQLAVPHIVGTNPSYVAFLAELFGSFLLLLIYIGSESRGHKGMKIVIAFGAAVAAIFAVNVSGAWFNPIYTLAIEIVTGDWYTDVWLYYVAPLVSAVVALIFAYLFEIRHTVYSIWIGADAVSQRPHTS